MEEIMDIVIRAAGTLAAGAVVWVCRKIYAYFAQKMKASDMEKLEKFVDTLVTGADQMFKAEDPDGSVRLAYVQGELISAGYDLTEAVRALIESKVFKVNLAQKGVEQE